MKGVTAGQEAEGLAYQYLKNEGLKLLSRNYHCKSGEIDLIMTHGKILVFIEVRYRSNEQFGLSIETVTKQKQKKLIKTALHFLQKNPNKAKQPARFDVLGLTGDLSQPKFTWIQNAFDG